MIYRVVVSGRAQANADKIFAWIETRSPSGARKWYVAFHSAMRKLPNNPLRHSSAPEADQLGVDLRQAFFKTRKGLTYRALFVIEDDVIHVVSVRGSGQDLVTWSDLELPE